MPANAKMPAPNPSVTVAIKYRVLPNLSGGELHPQAIQHTKCTPFRVARHAQHGGAHKLRAKMQNQGRRIRAESSNPVPASHFGRHAIFRSGQSIRVQGGARPPARSSATEGTAGTCPEFPDD